MRSARPLAQRSDAQIAPAGYAQEVIATRDGEWLITAMGVVPSSADPEHTE